MRRIPIFATVIVAAAIAVMIALGFWQLGRMEEKDALIQRAERSLEMAEPVGYPSGISGDLFVVYLPQTLIVCSYRILVV